MTTKAQIINSISADLGVTKKVANAFLASFASKVQTDLSVGGEALIPGIGKLKIRERSARAGRNPRTGESLNISARKTIRLASAKGLKTLVNTPVQGSAEVVEQVLTA
jgi:nucleoid DNA-binding protein